MKKIALKIAFWANSHVRLAQMLIFLIATLLCTLSFIIGVLLQGTWEIPAFTSYLLVVCTLLIWWIYYSKANSFLYKKTLIGLLFGLSFMLSAYFGYEQAFLATRENIWVRQNASLNFPASTSTHWTDDLPNYRKLVRKFIRAYKPLIKAYINKHYKGAKKVWLKILLTVLLSLVYFVLLVLIVVVACSAACSGYALDANLILWGGFSLTTAGFVFLLMKIWKGKETKSDPVSTPQT
ncbi:MAG: hypothetical protein NZ516_05830 [Raineya sp.]|nr:hypothetical protein [Raineya sp.]